MDTHESRRGRPPHPCSKHRRQTGGGATATLWTREAAGNLVLSQRQRDPRIELAVNGRTHLAADESPLTTDRSS